MPEATLSRFLYRWSAFLALPGGLWAAFEMYGLTLRGSQMHFFTIAHTMLPLVLAVWLSVPAGVAWLSQSVAAIALPTYRAKLSIPLRTLHVFVVAICVHAGALAWYDSWSVTPLRVPICVLGLVLTAFCMREAWLEVCPTTPQSPRGAASNA